MGDGLHVIDAIMIFRDNVRPEWEDKLNATGGHFQFQLKPNIGGGQVDEYWNNLVLGMIGATIEPVNLAPTGSHGVFELQREFQFQFEVHNGQFRGERGDAQKGSAFALHLVDLGADHAVKREGFSL